MTGIYPRTMCRMATGAMTAVFIVWPPYRPAGDGFNIAGHFI